MKAITLGVLCACALTLAVSISVSASSITLLDVANSQVRDGAYAGFYTLNIDGQNVLAMCDDFATNSTIGETWTGTIFSYPTINSGAGKFGPNPVAYSQVDWLFSQAPSVSFTDQASIDEAI